jgi:aspartyl-tRNA(Asn)/glutamyl-tRNA(Gln) amidotransferase subunit C
MKINETLVEKLADLSRLSFSEAERKKIEADLQQMIGFVEKLNEVDTTDVAPLLHMSDVVNVLRADEVKNSITTQEALKNVPIKDHQFIKVPKVINK